MNNRYLQEESSQHLKLVVAGVKPLLLSYLSCRWPATEWFVAIAQHYLGLAMQQTVARGYVSSLQPAICGMAYMHKTPFLSRASVVLHCCNIVYVCSRVGYEDSVHDAFEWQSFLPFSAPS